ncbi:kynureninase [Rhodobacteraceae bacterium DSL-40]|uniref:kynureninase n=1 Tax=Amaricoccus sp. B4 TaxID=3368557 RepID=UPI000DAB4D32
MVSKLDWADVTAQARALDVADPLGGFREEFALPAGIIYLDGNSLGPAPKAALSALETAAREEWATDLVTSWNHAGWFDLPSRCGDRIAPLIGADAGEVVSCDTVSLNIFKCLGAALQMRPDRRVIIAEAGSFPTDLYVTEGFLGLRPGLSLRLAEPDGAELSSLIDDDVAAVLVNQVDYRTGRVRDLPALTRTAHDAGAVVIWDLCHSAGVMEVGLNAAAADMAVGCSYKYLNGGPGAPAFVFAAERHHATIRQPLSGWWGHATPFDFTRSYRPDPGIRRFLCGTQPILSFRAMEAGLEIAGRAGIARVREKGKLLTQLFIDLVEAGCEGRVQLVSPRSAEDRGSQVAFAHPEGYAIVQALIARGVIGDFRNPDILRFGFAPLYLRHADVAEAARQFCAVVTGDVWRDPVYANRSAVT